MEQTLTDSGWRGSPDVWLNAAYETLLDSGVDAVRIQTLSKKLNLARTSFYRSFEDREELLAALLTRWRDKNTGSIVRQANAYADSLVEAILNVSDCWFNNEIFDSKFEFAVRSWAMQSPETLAEVHEADRTRIRAIGGMFVRFGENEFAADVRARNIYLLQIGYISMQMSEDIALRMKRMPEYLKGFTGKPPKQKDLDRFFARHGITPEQMEAAHD